MKLFFDQTISRKMVDGVKALGIDATHLLEAFDSGTKDRVWIKYVGQNEYCYITHDAAQRRRPHEYYNIQKYKIGVFVLRGANMGEKPLGMQLIKALPQIVEKAENSTKPFMYYISSEGRLCPKPIDKRAKF